MKSFVALGQSNSILYTGFLNAIKTRGAARFLGAKMLGASPSVIGPYFMNEAFLEAADYCLIDTCIVDVSILTNGTSDLLQISRWIEWIGNKCRMHGCQPIFILLPVQTIVFADPPLLSIYLAIINESRYLYVDVRDLISAEIGSDRAKVASLYTDPAHIGPVLVDRIATIVSRFFALENDTVGLPTKITCCDRDFSVIKLKEYATDFAVMDYKNSLASFSGVHIEEHNVIQLEIGEILRVHAIYVNSAKCRAKLRLVGDVEVVKSFNLRPYSQVQFEARIIPVKTKIKDLNGFLRISIAETDAECDEMTMQESSEFSGSAFVEIESILIETSVRIVEYATRIPSASWDLLKILK